MNIYSSKTIPNTNAFISKSHLFLTCPIMLDETMAGDADFDPLGFVQAKGDLMNYQEAEIKHGRLAILAAAEWPLKKLFDEKISSLSI